ncbi:MAG: hypothetical protein KF789_01015, partial [Bdellovibrionaceae bacterium]|nr:hypothetical protein [Pseudobdellovibrionaceae bacterium]
TLLLREWAPPMLLTALSYFVLWSEILFAPMALWKPTRIAAWITLTGMHLSLLVICNFAHVSAGMLLVHLFLFDVSWIPQQTRASLYARLHNRRLPTR